MALPTYLTTFAAGMMVGRLVAKNKALLEQLFTRQSVKCVDTSRQT